MKRGLFRLRRVRVQASSEVHQEVRDAAKARVLVLRNALVFIYYLLLPQIRDRSILSPTIASC